jgi:hypothetical protein
MVDQNAQKTNATQTSIVSKNCYSMDKVVILLVGVLISVSNQLQFKK